MAKKPQPKSDDPEQSKRDETVKGVDRAFETVAKPRKGEES